MKYFSWRPFTRDSAGAWTKVHLVVGHKTFCGLTIPRKLDVFDYSSSRTANDLCAKCEARAACEMDYVLVRGQWYLRKNNVDATTDIRQARRFKTWEAGREACRGYKLAVLPSSRFVILARRK